METPMERALGILIFSIYFALGSVMLIPRGADLEIIHPRTAMDLASACLAIAAPLETF
ncbi:hypothetical protein HY970_00265 [Candidatus Kaiserbacteria bacterium]|nr:hypothetical protein [Candidatus Kaiserbacteria bacterium]